MEEGGAHGKHAAEIYQGQKDVPTPNLQKEMADCDDSGVKSKEEMGMLFQSILVSLFYKYFCIQREDSSIHIDLVIFAEHND